MGFLRDRKLAYAAIVALIIVVIAAAMFGMQYKDRNTVMLEGVVFSSDSIPPTELMSRLAEEQEFIVVAETNEKIGAIDNLMFNGLALFLVVLEGNQKNTVQVYWVVDSGGNLVSCNTNLGDVKTEEVLGAEECKAMVESHEGAVILLKFPNNSLQNPRVLLSEKKIVVEANDAKNINTTAFTALRAMFSNAYEVLDKSNAITQKLG